MHPLKARGAMRERNVWTETFRKPIRWVLSPVVWTVFCSALSYASVSHNRLMWAAWWVAGVCVITLLVGMSAAQRMANETRASYESRIDALRAEAEKEWNDRLTKLKSEKQERCRKRVEDFLRNRRDFGAPVEELSQQIPEFSIEEITESLRYWDERRMAHMGGRGHWIWDSSMVKKAGSGRFGD